MNWRFGKVGWRLLPGAIAAILMAGLLNSGLVKPLEQVVYSSLFRLRGERQWDDRLVLVTIDDLSIKQIGRFPWKRTQYVTLIDRLTQADASVIAIDLLFSESTPEDQTFANAITRSNCVVLAQGEGEQGAPLLPVPNLETAAVGSGHIRIQPDEDGITRSIETQASQAWAFGLTTAMTYSMLREVIAPSELSQRLWLNWVGRTERIPQYSFTKVVRGEVPDAAFRHKIVVVGVTAAAIDAAPTPFDRTPPASGVHLQAVLINNLLQRNSLTPLVTGEISLLILAIGGISFSVLLSYWRMEIQLAIATVSILGWVGISVVLLKADYLPPVVFPIGLMMGSTVITVIVEQSRISRALRDRVNQLQQHYESTFATPSAKDRDRS